MAADVAQGGPVAGANATLAPRRPLGLMLGLCASILGAGHCAAADLSILVRTQTGRPVADTVVTIYPSARGDTRRLIHFDWPPRNKPPTAQVIQTAIPCDDTTLIAL